MWIEWLCCVVARVLMIQKYFLGAFVALTIANTVKHVNNGEVRYDCQSYDDALLVITMFLFSRRTTNCGPMISRLQSTGCLRWKILKSAKLILIWIMLMINVVLLNENLKRYYCNYNAWQTQVIIIVIKNHLSWKKYIHKIKLLWAMLEMVDFNFTGTSLWLRFVHNHLSTCNWHNFTYAGISFAHTNIAHN